MKRILIFLIIVMIGGSSYLYSQRTKVKVIQGNGEHLTKIETQSVVTVPKIIHLQIFQSNKEPCYNKKIVIQELDSQYDCDSLGNIFIEIPAHLTTNHRVCLTLQTRIRKNGWQVILIKKRITIDLQHIPDSKKIILSNYKVVKSYVSGGGCPSF